MSEEFRMEAYLRGRQYYAMEKCRFDNAPRVRDRVPVEFTTKLSANIIGKWNELWNTEADNHAVREQNWCEHV